METVNAIVSAGTNIPITNSSSQAKAGKSNAKDKTVKIDFTKLLGEKSNDSNVKELSIQNIVNQLVILLTDLETNISSKDQSNGAKVNLDTQGKLILKDSIDNKTKDLISLLSSLLNQLNAKPQSNELTSKVDLNSTEAISKLITELHTKISKQSQPLNEIVSASKIVEQAKIPIAAGNTLSFTKEAVDASKIVKQAKIPITVGNTMSFVKQAVNESKIVEQAKTIITSGNTMSLVKQVKEISNVIEQLLSSVKAEGTITTVKTNDLVKLEGILKNLAQVVDIVEKQVTPKNTTVDMQTLVKPQILLSSSSNNDASKQDNGFGYTKSNADADKVLQKIAKQDGSDKTQSFDNLVTRASNQNNIATTKVVDNVVISKDSLTSDVIKTVKFMNTNDIKDLTVKITPKDLGEVVIKLTQEGNVMKATITTSNKEAYQLINSNLQEINDKISSNNTSIQSFSVDVFNGERSFLKQGSQQNNEAGKGKNGKAGSFEDDDGVEAISNDDSNLNILV